MRTHAAILNVTKTLVNLLWNSIKNDSQVNLIISSENQISLASPKIFETETCKKLSLFLYQITEFSSMRSLKGKDSNQNITPQLPLTLHYLVTPNTQNIENDQILLGKIIKVFADNCVFVDPLKQGSISKNPAYLRLMLNHLSIDELTKLWSILGTHYRLSISYSVSPIKIGLKEKRWQELLKKE